MPISASGQSTEYHYEQSYSPPNNTGSRFNFEFNNSDLRSKQVYRTDAFTCKFCDRRGHTENQCRRKLGQCLAYGSKEHRVYECPTKQDSSFPLRNSLNRRPSVRFETRNNQEYEDQEVWNVGQRGDSPLNRSALA